jgi:hypothetical protein
MKSQNSNDYLTWFGDWKNDLPRREWRLAACV